MYNYNAGGINMVNLVLWEVNSEFTPKDPAKRMKLQMQMLSQVKENLEKGLHISWGMSPGGSTGYALTKLDGDKLFATLGRFSPNVKFTVKPMISVDEAIAVLKQTQAQLAK
jgi:hypothetical protein